MPNLARLMTSHAAEAPERRAIVLDDAGLSYGALDEASARLAGLLAARGVGPGDRVGLIMPNLPYFPVALYGSRGSAPSRCR